MFEYVFIVCESVKMNVFLRGTNLHDPYLLYTASVACEKAGRDRVYMTNIARTALLDILRLVDKKAGTGEYLLVWSLLAMDCVQFMSFEVAVAIVMTVVHELERKGFLISKIGQPLPVVLVIEWSKSGKIEYADTVGETYGNLADFKERFRPCNFKLLSKTGIPPKLDVYAADKMAGPVSLPEKRRITYEEPKRPRVKKPKKPVLEL